MKHTDYEENLIYGILIRVVLLLDTPTHTETIKALICGTIDTLADKDKKGRLEILTDIINMMLAVSDEE